VLPCIMGIKGLTKLLGDEAPAASRKVKFESFFGRRVAVDASMHIYQAMVVVGRSGTDTLTTDTGESTAHLQGMLYRTARMLEAGIKPVYVFDGKPPELKGGELGKRLGKRGEATAMLEEAKEKGDQEAIEKYSKRTVKVTKQHNEECKELLRFMGVPVIEAPSEAEAECSDLCRRGLVYAVATEDMDALTFGASRLARNLMAPPSAKLDVMEFELEKVLQELQLTQEEFVDMCILLGCDYCGTIRGIGPKKALQLIKEHHSIKAILKSLDKERYVVPEDFIHEEGKKLFLQPEILEEKEIPEFKWSAPDEEGLVQFLVRDRQFNEDRVKKVIERIKSARGKATQGRLESFFGPTTTVKTPKRPSTEGKPKKTAAAKRVRR